MRTGQKSTIVTVMKIKRSWLLPAVLWAYFITAYVLYAYFHMAWVNTFDLLLGLAATVILSICYVVYIIRYPDPAQRTKSTWYVTSYGMIRKRRVPENPSAHEAENHLKG